ncbi:MAG: cadmium-translocating P-type ATPase [Desulfobacterales bacterium]|nr:cadmium-translocating P-type ATPase [Desulfobacterales bacterium]
MIEEKELRIKGLHCADCVKKIERTMSSLHGIHGIKLGFSTGKMGVRYDSDKISSEEIQSKIKSLGYDILEKEFKEENIFSLKNHEFLFALVSGIALFSGLFVSFLTPDPVVFTIYHHILLSGPFYAVAIIFGGYYVAQRAIKALYSRTFVIDSLMIIGALGAIFIDAFAEGAAVLFLFSIAELLEDYSVERSRRSLRELVNLTPKVASVKKGDRFTETPIEEIRAGDIILVKSGERIGVDGVIVKGESSVNQASITGESMPLNKGIGDIVFAGTINQEGRIEVKAAKEAKDSTLAKIIELVESAEEQKSPTERFVDRFAKYYTPFVVGMAVCIAAIPILIFHKSFDVWFYKAILLLLISCPCALALSTPISIASGITSGAKNGVLFKGGVFIEKLAKVDTFAFDKTGTLTEGKPLVTDIIPFNSYSREEILSIASSLECLSAHPLGKAIVERAEQEGVSVECVDDFIVTSGKGIQGRINNEIYMVGSKELFDTKALSGLDETLSKLEDEAKTIVVVGRENKVAGVIGITDKIRDNSRYMIECLRQMGVRRIVMITGDNERVAKAVAAKIGIDEYYAELLPDKKVSIIKEIGGKDGRVAMVGDGVNDAPALATAHVGIAMGAAGSDIALEVANIALMNDDLSKIPYLLSLGKKTMGIVKQNIVLSIGIKLLFAILVFPGFVTLWMAVAIGDMGVSLLVILNALRLSNVR